MCEIFAFSSSAPTRVRFALEEFRQHGCAKGPHCDGWGLAFVDGPYAQVFREVEPAAYSAWMAFLVEHQHYSQCVISHIRRATQGGVNLQNTQPFSRESHGVRHVFAHNGNLKNWVVDESLDRFTPIGDTDSERAFCELMERIYELPQKPAPTLTQRLGILELSLRSWAQLGPANIVYSDGEYLYAFANRRTQIGGKIEPPGLHYLKRQQHPDPDQLTGVTLDGEAATITLVASVPLSKEKWLPFQENELIVFKNGEIIYQKQLAH